ncbi:MAG: cytochrome b/b6 domain-containing protein [Deltaproteobacteria bacterium]|nr:cytochrome b/b6 domain-containing protein [Deltaproteobacteria bacterium]
MEWFRRERNPWGQEILVGLSWDLIWVAVAAGLLLIVAHALLYYWRLRMPGAGAGTINESLLRQLPERILRHSLASRIFHWVMAVSVLVLLFTAFLPIWGIKFPWVTPHWIAGLVLTVAIIFHIVHVSFWKGLSLMWISRQECRDEWLVIKRLLGSEVPRPGKPGKNPLENKLFHHAASISALATYYRHGPDYDGQGRHSLVESQPLCFVRRYLGDHLRLPWGRKRGADYPGHGSFLFRHSARETLDYPFHVSRLDLSGALSRAP